MVWKKAVNSASVLSAVSCNNISNPVVQAAQDSVFKHIN